jgi:uncharacterized protein (TIGR02588 family)
MSDRRGAEMSAPRKASGAPRKASGPRKNRLEWLVFAVSLAVIAGTVGVLVYGSLTLEDSPPRLEVYLGEPRERLGSFVVPVVVENRGTRPAAGVKVEVILTGGKSSEQGGFDIAYAPGGSTRRGEVVFSTDPRRGTLKARVPGFEFP